MNGKGVPDRSRASTLPKERTDCQSARDKEFLALAEKVTEVAKQEIAKSVQREFRVEALAPSR